MAPDAAELDCAHKLQEYARIARRERSEGKATWPGRKQVTRSYGLDAGMIGDVLTLDGDAQAGDVLLRPVMRAGQRLEPAPGLDALRARGRRTAAPTSAAPAVAGGLRLSGASGASLACNGGQGRSAYGRRFHGAHMTAAHTSL
ncbi:MAG: hypothetical protein ACREIB_03220 [Pseudomonadota bacterium]